MRLLTEDLKLTVKDDQDRDPENAGVGGGDSGGGGDDGRGANDEQTAVAVDDTVAAGGAGDESGSWLGELAAESGSWAPAPEPEPRLPPAPEPEPELIHAMRCHWLDDSAGPDKPPIVRDLECAALPWLAVPNATVTLADPCCQEKLLVSTRHLYSRFLHRFWGRCF